MESWLYWVIAAGVLLVGGIICVVLWRVGVFGASTTQVAVAAGSGLSSYDPCVGGNTSVTLDSTVTDLPAPLNPGVSFGSSKSAVMMVYNPDGKPASSVLQQFSEGTTTQVLLNVPGLILQPRSVACIGPFLAAYAVTVSADGSLNYATGSTLGTDFTDYNTYVVVDSFSPNSIRTLNSLFAPNSNETPELLSGHDGYLYVAWFNRATTNTIVRSYTLGKNGLPSVPTDLFTIQAARPIAWDIKNKTMCISANNTIMTFMHDGKNWNQLNTTLATFAVNVQVCGTGYYLAANDGNGTVTLYSRTDLTSNYTFLNSVSDSTLGNTMTFITITPGLLIACTSGSAKYLSCTIGSPLTTWTGYSTISPASFVGGGVLETLSGGVYDSFCIMSNDATISTTVDHFVECH